MSQLHLPREYDKKHPVSVDDMKSYWKNAVYNMMVKKANWTTRFKYNIICLHPSCKIFSGWNTRMNMASFNKHYGNVHKIKGQ